jgi:hypothetical protein
MNWIYLVKADYYPRVQSRIFQILDKQMVTVSYFTSVKTGSELRLRIDADAGLCGGPRLAALILRLEGIRSARAIEHVDRTAELTRRFQIANIVSEQSGLLDLLRAMGANVTLVTPTHIDFEGAGGSGEIEEIIEVLRSYRPIEMLFS